jgi:hypothetical protein
MAEGGTSGITSCWLMRSWSLTKGADTQLVSTQQAMAMIVAECCRFKMNRFILVVILPRQKSRSLGISLHTFLLAS